MVRTLGFQPGKFGSTPNGTTSGNNEILLFRACDTTKSAGVKGRLSCLAFGPRLLNGAVDTVRVLSILLTLPENYFIKRLLNAETLR